MSESATHSIRVNSIYFPYWIDLWHLSMINVNIAINIMSRQLKAPI